MTTTKRTSFTPGRSGFFYASLGALLLGAAACGGAAAPTTELQTARNVYAQARNGEAAQLNPTGVHDAYQALNAAEKVHEDDAGSERERHYAYIALRRSELAIAQASEALAKKEQERAEQTYQAQLEQQSREATQESSQYAQQLQQNTQSLQQNQQQLEEARIAAEQAQAELRQAQAMKEEAGRLIISLAGVLFETGGAELSEPAQQRLETVVRALRAYPDRPIVIEGYTDAKGSEDNNRELSQRRADAVREYLQARGVDPSRLRAVGRGESNPIASNDTPEGRANNRRVEIIVDREGGSRSAEAEGADSDRQNVSGRDTGSESGEATRPAPAAQPKAGQPKASQPKTAPPPAPPPPMDEEPAPSEPAAPPESGTEAP